MVIDGDSLAVIQTTRRGAEREDGPMGRRAYASIPARHDLFRRVDAGYLARLVLEHRLSLAEAVDTAVDLAYNLPKQSYRRR